MAKRYGTLGILHAATAVNKLANATAFDAEGVQTWAQLQEAGDARVGK
jgi:hypothetical protein